MKTAALLGPRFSFSSRPSLLLLKTVADFTEELHFI